MPTDPTLNPNLRSWVESASDPASDFPIQNLPLCCFEVEHAGGDGHGDHPHIHVHNGVAIGDQVLDVTALIEAGLFDTTEEDQDLAEVVAEPSWLGLAMEPEYVPTLRTWLVNFLRHDTPFTGQQARRLRQHVLRPIAETTFRLPTTTVNYSDFYASVHHATNVGSMFRPDNPLLPNYKHVPIGYHGRASSLVPSGTPIYRPHGQKAPAEDKPGVGPTFGPSTMLDYELELAAVIAGGNELGHAIPIDACEGLILGLCLLNDWSARDLQKWEYQPLGPFLAKSFATSAGPFLVTLDALDPFRIPGPYRGEGDPQPLPYLWDKSLAPRWGFDITLEVHLRTEQMRSRNIPAHRLSHGTFKDMFWTFQQMVAHHVSNGCNLMPGDMIGSGTISGPARDSRGCLLELTWDGDPWATPPKVGTGRTPIALPSGESRTFLQDGDEVVLSAWCERDGFRRIGFGQCRGTVAARPEETVTVR